MILAWWLTEFDVPLRNSDLNFKADIKIIEAKTVSFTKAVAEALGAFEKAQGIYTVRSQNELTDYLYLSTRKRRCE